ncbi:lipocalin family protein [Pseudoxanthomonas dokdonensis]|uniref:Outer membrane lipoprotein Blc n=1 Tax=Pseudoxanthomonas dokdonensis TaxID=344882 RepID=A0A0R0CLI5_9GAMM|nr:lipocalin family protein [Pseudoxanthomonas dokdonensis]KRG70400.1 hypothetical protein ABB29_06490 [Pseudoxanthomonas dokdonensis]
MSVMRQLRVLFAACLLVALVACASQPVAPVRTAQVDLPRFTGSWYVIAMIPYFAERGNVETRYEYSLKDDDTLQVKYWFKEGFDQPLQVREAKASVHEDSANRRWTLWFGGVVPAKFNILEVAPDYSWALINYPGRDMGWIFARSPTIDDALYRQLVRKMRDYNINARQLVRVPQLPEQVGQPGFDTPEEP